MSATATTRMPAYLDNRSRVWVSRAGVAHRLHGDRAACGQLEPLRPAHAVQALAHGSFCGTCWPPTHPPKHLTPKEGR